MINAFEVFDDDSNREEIDWDYATWYFAPNNDDEILMQDEVQKDINICKQSIPFTTK